jgi:hypothetical protein
MQSSKDFYKPYGFRKIFASSLPSSLPVTFGLGISPKFTVVFFSASSFVSYYRFLRVAESVDFAFSTLS